MTTTSWLHRSRENLRALSGRTPLRIKIITALLALVAIALAVISLVSLAVFRNYLQGQAGTQVNTLYQHTLYELNGQQSSHFNGVYLPPIDVELLNSQGQVLAPTAPPGQNWAGPTVPTSASWLSAHDGQLAIVPGQSGSDNWQVITHRFTGQVTNFYTGQSTGTETLTLVVGINLGSVNQTLGWLGRIDLLVSALIVLALAVVGIAIVRTSLRPLTDIEQTAEAIAAGDLSRRVPDRDPRTEVGRLGRSLNTMLSQIESSFDAQSRSEAAARRSEERMRQFVADASHELRTPLTAMRGYAEYYRQRGGISEEPAAPAPEPGNAPALNGTPARGSPGHGGGQLNRADLDRIMQRVEQESARMGVLVEDMLLLARLDQQRPLERRPVDLLTLAADAVQDARIIAPDRAIDLSVGSATAFLVLGDEVRLRQVIGNLMSNALNHTPDGTPISVRILAGPRQPVPSVVLEVADQGLGMSPEQAEHVFERFYRGDQARTRKSGGTGLGLAIVAALVAAHGGTVTLDTAPGRGATFRITLPLAPEAQRDGTDQDADEDEPLPSRHSPG
jgi:two-component system OmpR family sensor kinase